MNPSNLPWIEKLSRAHSVEDFDCGSEPLNRFLTRFALQNQQAEASQTYVAVVDGRVVGYYTLVVGHVEYERAPETLRKGIARYPIPIMLLGRLAISVNHHGKGLGSGLVKDAIARTVRAADIAGIRAFTVHAKDDSAKRFYEHLGFVPFESDPYHLYRLLKEIRAKLKS